MYSQGKTLPRPSSVAHRAIERRVHLPREVSAGDVEHAHKVTKQRSVMLARQALKRQAAGATGEN